MPHSIIEPAPVSLSPIAPTWLSTDPNCAVGYHRRRGSLQVCSLLPILRRSVWVLGQRAVARSRLAARARIMGRSGQGVRVAATYIAYCDSQYISISVCEVRQCSYLAASTSCCPCRDKSRQTFRTCSWLATRSAALRSVDGCSGNDRQASYYFAVLRQRVEVTVLTGQR